MKKILLPFCFSLFINHLLHAQSPQLYGMTTIGGENNGGVIFKINLEGDDYNPFYSFSSGANGGGDSPQGDLMLAPNNKLYSTAFYGGVNGYGSIFSYDISKNAYSDVHDFDSITGFQANGSLIAANDGNLYGMTSVGGAHDLGVIYVFNPDSNTYRDIHDFDSVGGSYPNGNLLQIGNGKLYGLTALGGNSDEGVLFNFDPGTHAFTKLYDFSTNSGIYPNASLVNVGSKLYGTASYGGANGDGTLFSYDTATQTFSKFYDFTGNGGFAPEGNLTFVDSVFYGTAYNGGVNNFGVIFSYDTTTNTFTDVFNFNDTLGEYPPASLLLASDGNLYGMTQQGGTDSSGVIFSLSGTDSCIDVFNFFDTIGVKPNGNLIEISSAGIQQLTVSTNHLLIYPNPTAGLLNISSNNLPIDEIRITNMLGQVVYTSYSASNTKQLQVDVSGFMAGIYFVSFTSNNKTTTRKFSIISK